MRNVSATLLGSQLAAAGLVITWSSGFVGARLGTGYAPPDTLLAWRFLIAAALLIAWASTRGSWAPRGSRLKHGTIGLLTQCGYLGGVVGGVALGVPAGTAALIAALQPPLVGAVAGRLLGEQVSRRQWCGVWAGLAGVALVVAADVERGVAAPAAYLLPLVGMVSLSAGTVLEHRWRPSGSVVEALTAHCLVAAGVFVTLAVLGGRLAAPPGVGFWAAVAWVVVLSHFGGYGCYLVVLRSRGATAVSTLLYLTPPATMIWAWAMFGDPIGLVSIAGLMVCVVAVWLVTGRRERSSEKVGRRQRRAWVPPRDVLDRLR